MGSARGLVVDQPVGGTADYIVTGHWSEKAAEEVSTTAAFMGTPCFA
jgi:hypothetical protein